MSQPHVFQPNPCRGRHSPLIMQLTGHKVALQQTAANSGNRESGSDPREQLCNSKSGSDSREQPCNGESGSDSGEVAEGGQVRRGGPKYAVFMTKVYNKVTEAGLVNYMGAHLELPSNLYFSKWEALAETEEDTNLINFLKYGFPMQYEDPMLTPADHNHTYIMHYTRDVAGYVLTVLEVVMLGMFEAEPFFPLVSSEHSTHPPKER